jgi:hypothetical protein
VIRFDGFRGDDVELPDFFDIVTVLDSEQTRRRGIAGEEGVILGKSTEDDSRNGKVVSFAVSVGENQPRLIRSCCR